MNRNSSPIISLSKGLIQAGATTCVRIYASSQYVCVCLRFCFTWIYVYVCVCVCLCVYIYTYTFMYAYMCIKTCIQPKKNIFTFLHISVHSHTYARAPRHTHKHLFSFTYDTSCSKTSVRKFVHARLCVCVSVFVPRILQISPSCICNIVTYVSGSRGLAP